MNAWKRGLAVTCSHAQMVLPDAMETLQRFADDWKPTQLVHLGDFLDTTAFRSGAADTSDEGADVDFDLTAGLLFVRDFFDINRRANVRLLFRGNHDERPYTMTRHPKALVRKAAKDVCSAIEFQARKSKVELIPYDIKFGWRHISERMMAGHGYMFNEQAARDHAEMLGCSCMFGHVHKVLIQPARSVKPATGFSIGWLGEESKARYARHRRATLAWENAFAAYETNGIDTVIHIQRRTETGWTQTKPQAR